MKDSLKILVLHGPNLNLLGLREAEHYGNITLKQINQNLQTLAKDLSAITPIIIDCMQSNSEGTIVDTIQQAPELKFNGIIINPAAYGHTSIAIRDALLAVKLPFIEVHISNIYQRESFRHHTYLSDIASGVIVGLGPTGYLIALQALINIYLPRN